MQSIAETCVRFDAAHLSINLVSEIAVPMFTTLRSLLLAIWLQNFNSEFIQKIFSALGKVTQVYSVYVCIYTLVALLGQSMPSYCDKSLSGVLSIHGYYY